MKNKEILKNYFYWIITFLGCMLIGIIRTYAITFTDFTDVHSNTTLYVGYADSGNPISWPFNNSNLYQNNIISLDYVVNKQIVANTHYEFESHMLANKLIGTSIYSVVDANGNTCLTDSYYLNFLNGEYPRWDFQCSNNSSGFTIHIQQSNSSRLFNDGYMGWGSAILSKSTTPISSSGNDTQEIIDNANANANQIIDNQNQNTQDIINSNRVCSIIDKNNIYTDKKFLDTSGNEQSNNNYGITNYIDISNSILSINSIYTFNNVIAICYYDNDKSLISCEHYYNKSSLTIPSNTIFIRASINKGLNKPTLKLCTNGNQANNDAINGLNDTLNDDDTDGAVSDASDFFSDFTTDTFGLTSIITAPLNLIQSLSSSTCSQLELPLPYLDNKKLILPCMTTIYSQYFGSFFTMYQTITYGIIAYWVIVRIFNLVKDFKNPEHDEIEVVDL